MLGEYFMHITPEGRVETLPLLLRRYTPNLDRLPLFLMRIALKVEISRLNSNGTDIVLAGCMVR
jgi:hypothetical protein